MSFLDSSYVVLFIFASTVVGLIKYQRRPERVFGSVLVVLYASNLVTTEQVIDSFANPGLLTLVLLMVCSLALEKTKLLRKLALCIIGPSYRGTWFRLFGTTVLASAFLNNTAVVSTLLAPIRNNPHHSASRLLLPLSYAAILGGTLTLIGTSTNLIVNSMVLDFDLQPLRFFDFTLIGSLLVLGGGLVLSLSSRWLPMRAKQEVKATEYFIDAEVLPDSNLVGKTIEENGLRHLESLFLVEIQREGRLMSSVSPQDVIEAGDRLLFSGDIKKVTLLNQFDGLSLFAKENGLPIDNLIEVVVTPDSVLQGQTLKAIGFRALFDAAVVAMKRDGETVSGKLGEVEICAGDYLVLAVGEDFKTRRNIQKNFYLISEVETEHQLQGIKGQFTVVGFVAAITLSALDLIPLFQGMSLLLAAYLFFGCLTTNEVFQRFPRQVWLIIASALLLSQALINTGSLDTLGKTITQNASLLTPFVGLVAIYIMTWVLTELVTNNAAAALVFPIAYGLAMSLNANLTSYIFAVAFGASASFISPYGYQTNLMVYNAGQYKISDFLKIGLPMSMTYGVITVSAIYFIYGV